MIFLINMPLNELPYFFALNIVILAGFSGYVLWVFGNVGDLEKLPKSPLAKSACICLIPLLILIFGVIVLTWSSLKNEGRGYVTLGELTVDQRFDADLSLRGNYVEGSLIEGSNGNSTVFEMTSDNTIISVTTNSDIPGRLHSGRCNILLYGGFKSDDIFWAETLRCVPDDNVAYLLSAYGMSWVLLFGYMFVNTRRYRELKDILKTDTISSQSEGENL